jgi:predicted anti-sigma-YlaC factor YlaD
MASAGIEPIMRTLMRPLIGSCEETREQLSEHLDGSLGAQRERRVSRHLRYCRRCRLVYESLVRTVESVRAIGRRPDPEPDVSVADAVAERIRRSDL